MDSLWLRVTRKQPHELLEYTSPHNLLIRNSVSVECVFRSLKWQYEWFRLGPLRTTWLLAEALQMVNVFFLVWHWFRSLGNKEWIYSPCLCSFMSALSKLKTTSLNSKGHRIFLLKSKYLPLTMFHQVGTLVPPIPKPKYFYHSKLTHKRVHWWKNCWHFWLPWLLIDWYRVLVTFITWEAV